MISLTSYSETRAEAQAWTGTLPAVHINLFKGNSLGSVGYVSISPDNARDLAIALLDAVHAVEHHMRQLDAAKPQVVTGSAAA